MPRRRYFRNSLPDFSGSEVVVPSDRLISMAKSISEKIRREHPVGDERKFDGGLYIRNSGIAYAFYHLSKAFDRKNNVVFALEYLFPALDHLEKRSRSDPAEEAAFILGDGGTNALASVIYHAGGNVEMSKKFYEKYLRAARVCTDKSFTVDEVFVGRAGYILGMLWLCKQTGRPVPTKELHEVAKAVIDSGRKHSSRTSSKCPLMYAYYDTEYLGAAHGLCSILLALMCVPGFLDENPGYAKDVRTSVDFILGLQTPAGNFPCAMEDLGQRARPLDEELVHWCHGAPGVIYLMAKAYAVWKESKYLKSCRLACDTIWERGLLYKGPGICHGVAGNAYAFLLLYRLTAEPQHLHRAIAFAHFLETDEFKVRARVPDHPFSLFEGIAGTCCFLVDLAKPQTAAFPFMDIL